jgi:hypothetical protein
MKIEKKYHFLKIFIFHEIIKKYGGRFDDPVIIYSLWSIPSRHRLPRARAVTGQRCEF